MSQNLKWEDRNACRWYNPTKAEDGDDFKILLNEMGEIIKV